MMLLVSGLVSVPKRLILEAFPTLLVREVWFAWLPSGTSLLVTSGVNQRLA